MRHDILGEFPKFPDRLTIYRSCSEKSRIRLSRAGPKLASNPFPEIEDKSSMMVRIFVCAACIGQDRKAIVTTVEIHVSNHARVCQARGRPLFHRLGDKGSSFDGVCSDHDPLVTGPIEQLMSRRPAEGDQSPSARHSHFGSIIGNGS